jgi:hypothetical protein
MSTLSDIYFKTSEIATENALFVMIKRQKWLDAIIICQVNFDTLDIKIQ